MELNSGQMERNIKDNIKMVQKLEKVYLNFQTEATTKASF